MALRWRAEHQESHQFGRVDRHDLDRFGADAFGARHLLAAEREELVLKPRGRLPLPHLAVDLVRALARSTSGEEVFAALLIGHSEVIPLRAPLLVP